MSGGRLRVSVICLPGLPVVDPSLGGAIGGTETRAWTLAKSLAAGGAEVRFLVRGPAAASGVRHGVHVEALQDRLHGWYVDVGRSVRRVGRFPFARVERWSPSLLWKLPVVAAHRIAFGPPAGGRLVRHVASLPGDVLLVFGVTSTSAAVLEAGVLSERPVVVAVGCDDDLDTRYATDPQFVSPYGDRADDCRRVLTEADAVIVQTPNQAGWLRDRFGRDGILIPNPIDRTVWSSRVPPSTPPGVEPGYALWVGRAEGVHKRPQDLIEVARHAPDTPFLMVLNPADASVEATVREAAPPNVTIIERVPPAEMPGVFAAAGCLVNTSSVEGFPNTFLQAAAVGLPVLSLSVLGEWLQEWQVGRAFAGDAASLAAAIPSAAAAPRSVAEGLLQRHDVTTVCDTLTDALRSVVRSTT